jgi:plasmid stabilization system protein ParE
MDREGVQAWVPARKSGEDRRAWVRRARQAALGRARQALGRIPDDLAKLCGVRAAKAVDESATAETLARVLGKRAGPGRPPIDPDGETVQLTLRVSQVQARKLAEIVKSGAARTPTEAARWAIDQAKVPHQG